MLIKTDINETATEIEEMAHIPHKHLVKIVLHDKERGKTIQTDEEFENQCGPAGPPIDERDLGARILHTQNKEDSSIFYFL